MNRTPPPAFVTLLHAQQEPLVRAARLLTGDWERAEDLMLRTLTWALTNWPVIEDAGMPAALAVRQRLVELYLADQDEPDEEVEDGLESLSSPSLSSRALSSPALPSAATAGTTAPVEEVPGGPPSLLDSLTVLTPMARAIVVARYYLSLSAAEISAVVDIEADEVNTAAVSVLAALRRGTVQVGGEG